jgi:hypothetical protein
MIEVPLHRDAPTKPPEGEPCNGCGVCCALERCPMAWLLLPRGDSRACAALEWSSAERRYRCGLVLRPAHHVGWLPRRWEQPAARWIASRIAAGSGCDCGASELPLLAR